MSTSIERTVITMTTEASAQGGKKDSPGATVWKIVGTVVAAGVGLIVLFLLTKWLIPAIFSGFNGTLSAASEGMTEGGVQLNLLGMSFGVFVSGGFSLYLRVLIFALLFIILGATFNSVRKKMKQGSGSADPH